MTTRKVSKPDPPKFNLGDIVYLKSGSPAMTIDGIWVAGRLRVVWYNGLDYTSKYFDPCLLTLTNPNP